jgi:hypothetical protein
MSPKRWLLICALVLSSCAAEKAPSSSSRRETVWVKPGAEQSEFAQVRYQCLQEAQQRQTSFDGIGGDVIAGSTVQTNYQLFGFCMNAHGWYLQQREPVPAAPQQSLPIYVSPL